MNDSLKTVLVILASFAVTFVILTSVIHTTHHTKKKDCVYLIPPITLVGPPITDAPLEPVPSN